MVACPSAAVPSTSSATESPACATVSSLRARFQATRVSVVPGARTRAQERRRSPRQVEGIVGGWVGIRAGMPACLESVMALSCSRSKARVHPPRSELPLASPPAAASSSKSGSAASKQSCDTWIATRALSALCWSADRASSEHYRGSANLRRAEGHQRHSTLRRGPSPGGAWSLAILIPGGTPHVDA